MWGRWGRASTHKSLLFTEHLQQIGLFNRVSGSLIFTMQEKLSSPSEDGLREAKLLEFQSQKAEPCTLYYPRVLPSVLP